MINRIVNVDINYFLCKNNKLNLLIELDSINKQVTYIQYN